MDVWEQFIENANFEDQEGYHGDIIKKTMSVNGYDSHDRYAKTYHRLWMQTYYFDKIDIIAKLEEDPIEKIQIRKHIDVMGFFELALRSFIPMHITKRYIMKKGKKGELTEKALTAPHIMALKSLVTDNLIDLAKHISGLEKKLSGDDRYLGGINRIDKEKIDKPYELIIHDWIKKEESSIESGSMSFFKSLIFFIESNKFLEAEGIRKKYDNSNSEDESEKSKKKKFILNYLPVGYKYGTDSKEVDNLVDEWNSIGLRLRYPKLQVTDSSFGMMTIDRFSKRVVENFSHLYRSMHESPKVKSKTDFDKSSKYYFAMYICTFLNSFLIEFVESIRTDIPIHKGDIYIDIEEQETREKERKERKLNYIFDKVSNLYKNNALFYNLEIIQKYFNEDTKDTKDTLEPNDNIQETKDNLLTMILFVTRTLKYYHIWSSVLKEVYGYSDIYMAKEIDSKTKKVVKFHLIVVEDSACTKKINKKIREKKKELIENEKSREREEGKKIDNQEAEKNIRIPMDIYFYNEIYKKELKPLIAISYDDIPTTIRK